MALCSLLHRPAAVVEDSHYQRTQAVEGNLTLHKPVVEGNHYQHIQAVEECNQHQRRQG